ncbi:MAG: OmpA family protein [Deltaproteobacteria bacterium]|nr:OmpA family protein [Deltaproteobacteria bacterium]MBI3294205.1 OmpA family protein [Deltaproteobacteria bacterium]
MSGGGDDEFLWLMSLSDLMILLFIFFVVLFSFTYKKVKNVDMSRIAEIMRTGKASETPAEKLQKKMEEFTKQEHLDQMIEVVREEDTVRLEIKDKVLFASGDYIPTEGGVIVLAKLSKVLETVPKEFQIGIEGHTDDVPLRGASIRDNWELAARRSLAVFYVMNVTPELLKRIVVMAYGDQRPLVPNRDPAGNSLPENQAKNRRVTVRIFQL